MKKLIPVIILLGLMLTFSVATFAATNSNCLNVMLNNQKLNCASAYINNGRTMVPVRTILEATGAKVSWDPSTQKVTINKDNQTVTMNIGNNVINCNGNKVASDCAPVIKNGSTYLPVRTVCEAFGCNVGYNNGTVSINSGNCTGSNCPTGNCATGNCATGNCTTGNCKTSNCKTSNCTTGNCPTGNCTVSNCTTGNCKTSNCTTSNCPTGNCTTGNSGTICIGGKCFSLNGLTGNNSNCTGSNCSGKSTTTTNSTGSNNSASNSTTSGGSASSGSTASSSSLAQQVLQLVNKERAANGLAALTYSTDLENVAYNHSKDMAVNNYFSHTSLSGLSPFDRITKAGISYRAAGENIAAGQQTAQAVMDSWMNSAGHRANILSPNYTKIGIGVYSGGSYGIYWTQDFIG